MRVTHVCRGSFTRRKPLPFFLSRVRCGFPSPADDYVEGVLELSDLLIENKAATYFVRAEGRSMTEAGIQDGDLLVVDRSIEPAGGRVVVASLGGELTVKRLEERDGSLFLVPENGDFAAVEVDMELRIWGVVTYVIHDVE